MVVLTDYDGPVAPVPPLDDDVRRDILEQTYEFKLSKVVCLIGTFRPDGFPRFNRMGVLNDGWKSFMSTIRYPEKWKAADIRDNQRVTAIYTEPSIRPDHFLQIDGIAVELAGEEFEEWQRRRFVRWPHEIAQYDAYNNEWIGWIIEPLRVRVLGYRPRGSGYWSEAPLSFSRRDLGLPPLPAPVVRRSEHWPALITETSYRVPDLEAEVAFWEDVFGLDRVSPRAGQPLGRWASFDVGGSRLQFQRSDRSWPQPESRDDMHGESTFHVDHIDHVVERALAAGATAMTDLRTLGSATEPPVHKFIFMVSPGGVPFGLVEGDEHAYRRRLGMPPPRYW